jgi:hypothetical protein
MDFQTITKEELSERYEKIMLRHEGSDFMEHLEKLKVDLVASGLPTIVADMLLDQLRDAYWQGYRNAIIETVKGCSRALDAVGKIA